MNADIGGFLRPILRPVAARAARAYIAGPALADGLRVCRELWLRDLASTLGFWDGAGESPRQVVDTYLSSLDALASLSAIATPPLDCYLSIKPDAFGFDSALLDEVVGRAHATGRRVHFDSLGPEGADRSFALVAAARGRHADLGCTLPAVWRRSPSDAERAVELGLSVRVVKGQWPDGRGGPLDPRAGFLDVIDRLAGRARHVGVATHDRPLGREALRRLRERGTPCSLELLTGLPSRAALREAREHGTAARFYVPFGNAWLPYALSQARQKPRVLYWVLRDTLLRR